MELLLNCCLKLAFNHFWTFQELWVWFFVITKDYDRDSGHGRRAERVISQIASRKVSVQSVGSMELMESYLQFCMFSSYAWRFKQLEYEVKWGSGQAKRAKKVICHLSYLSSESLPRGPSKIKNLTLRFEDFCQGKSKRRICSTTYFTWNQLCRDYTMWKSKKFSLTPKKKKKNFVKSTL